LESLEDREDATIILCGTIGYKEVVRIDGTATTPELSVRDATARGRSCDGRLADC
jgi:hypothetical protein